MLAKFFWKLTLLFKMISVLKNWYMYPVVYFRLTKIPKVVFETRNGFKIIIRTEPKSTDIHVFTAIWLENIYTAPTSGTVIDIGSHIGIFCLYALQYCDRVFCFEPDTNNFNLLVENLKKNKAANVFVFKQACSSKTGNMQFYLSDHDLAAHNLYKKNTESFQEVKTITLEDIFNQNKIESCDFLKMNCEAAEYEIILNSSDNCLKKIRKISIQYHEGPINDLIKKLQDFNFYVQTRPTSNTTGFLYATASDLDS